MTKDEALDLAQGYLDRLIRGLNMDDTSEAVQVRDAIKQARAAPVQEPLTWLKTIETLGGFGKFVEAKPNEKGAKPVYLAPPAQPAPVQEPVATVQCINGVTIGYLDVMQPVGTKLYTTQPAAQRQWVGLTDEEIAEIYLVNTDKPLKPEWLFARAIEAKLKDKNSV